MIMDDYPDPLDAGNKETEGHTLRAGVCYPAHFHWQRTTIEPRISPTCWYRRSLSHSINDGERCDSASEYNYE